MTYEPVITAYAQILLLVVFGAAGWSKLRSLEAFEGVVYNFRILPENVSQPFAWFLPIAELGVALGLLFPITRAGAATGAIALLTVFCIAIAINLWRGRHEIDCGCFSSTLKQHLSVSLIIRNLLLTGLAGLLVLQPSGGGVVAAGQSNPALWLVGAAAAFVTVFIYTSAMHLKRYQMNGPTGHYQTVEEEG